ncbi:MAG: VWA domain-containing protein [Candidatus Thermoplasmatota archaeon]|nr:VWA domain-containing protein [Candidatus Thermoplasmatota archaeon]
MFKINANYKFKYTINRLKYNKAVTELVGSILLLGIIVSTIGIIYYNFLSIPPPVNPPNVSIIGYIENNNLVLEHQKGDSLPLDTVITINMYIGNVTFLVENYLDTNAKKDRKWDIGEKIIYPLPFTIDNIQSYFSSNIHVVDIKTNSLIFIGTLDVYPETDIGINITCDNLFPSIGSMVNITITVENHLGGTPARDIEILNLFSKNLLYVKSESTRGFYNPDTGIWNISYLENGESVSLTITVIVTITVEPTQLAIILDGSSSISSSSWKIMRTGLANAIKNPDIFPHDGTIELTVLQFGKKDWFTQYARKEIGPVIVTENNYLSITNTIQNLVQLGGYTPMSCGIYLAADTLYKSQFFNPLKRQIICMVTDGQPNCSVDPKTYTGKFVNCTVGRTTSEEGRDYLINKLNLTPSQDQFSVIAVGDDANTLWLKNKIVWPEPGNYAPPYIPGWVRNVSSWQEFSECVYEILMNLFGLNMDSYVKIIAVTPFTDPHPENNEIVIILKPE